LNALQADAEKAVEARGDGRPPHQIRGLLFEPVANEWLTRLPDEAPLGEYATNSAADRDRRQPPQASSLERVVSWADFIDENPGWKVFLPSQDEGIDAVGVMSDGQFMAIQHKCWNPDATLGSKSLRTFLLLSAVDHPDDPDARLFAHKLLVMTFDKVDGAGLDLLARHGVLIMKREYLEDHDDAWTAVLDSTGQTREQIIDSDRYAELHTALAALGLDPAAIDAEISATIARTSAAFEGDHFAITEGGDRGALLELAARQTVLYEHYRAAAAAVNRSRKVQMSILRDDHGFSSPTLARLITIFTPAAEMAKVRAKAAKKAAKKGTAFDPDSVLAVTGSNVQQMAIEGARLRGKRTSARHRNRGRPPEPAERHLATAYNQLAELKKSDPDQYDRILEMIDAGDGVAEEAGPRPF